MRSGFKVIKMAPVDVPTSQHEGYIDICMYEGAPEEKNKKVEEMEEGGE